MSRRLGPQAGRLLLAFALGAISVGGYAPFHLYALPILALAFLFRAWGSASTARAAMALGFMFGLGFFLAGTSWIYVSLHRFGGMPALLTAISTFVFCAVVALYPALAALLAHWLGRFAGDRTGAVNAMVVMPACWTLGELARGTLLTGFPWLGLGYSQIAASPLAGFAPVLGSYGVAWAAATCAGAIALVVSQLAVNARRAWLSIGVIVAIVAAGAAFRAIEWTQPEGKPVTVALLQGNVAQERKFSPEVLPSIFAQYRDMVEKTDARLVILPETAFPIFLHQLEPEYLAALAGRVAQRGGDLVFGIAIADFAKQAYYNAVISAGASAPQMYRKQHLVPFGEYLPLRFLFAWVLDVLHIPMADFDRGPASPPPIAVAGQRLAVSICYEDAFGSEMRQQLPAATALVNVSNDAWFGESLAAEQHWQIAQMRALESGRTMLRANNTGITGIIGPDGRTVARLPGFTVGALAGELQGRSGSTPYVRWGEPAVFIALVSVLAIVVAAGFAARGRTDS
nr:apolipoprotein N-acyltransferase [uncultured bacterium]